MALGDGPQKYVCSAGDRLPQTRHNRIVQVNQIDRRQRCSAVLAGNAFEPSLIAR
jgi:hypothetical protein